MRRHIETAAPNRGSRELLAHIRATKLSIPKFCEAKGLDRLRVQKAIHRGSSDLEFCVAIEKATGGDVLASWWTERLEETSGVVG